MEPNIENQKTFTNAQIIKFICISSVAVLAGARFEYKMDKIATVQQSIIEKFIMKDGFEKKELQKDIDALDRKFTKTENRLDNLEMADNFIKPEEIKFKHRKR
jgi:outer membrane murein-binding lipoprotein Lpp